MSVILSGSCVVPGRKGAGDPSRGQLGLQGRTRLCTQDLHDNIQESSGELI